MLVPSATTITGTVYVVAGPPLNRYLIQAVPLPRSVADNVTAVGAERHPDGASSPGAGAVVSSSIVSDTVSV